MPTADLSKWPSSWTGRASPTSRSPAAGSSTTPSGAGVESPWERIRALKARTTTPLALALRGRFLVGSRPVGGDFARRFVASAAQSGIEVFRLHDPLNDVDNLREAARRPSSTRAPSSRPGSSTGAAAARRSSTRRSACPSWAPRASS